MMYLLLDTLNRCSIRSARVRTTERVDAPFPITNSFFFSRSVYLGEKSERIVHVGAKRNRGIATDATYRKNGRFIASPLFFFLPSFFLSYLRTVYFSFILAAANDSATSTLTSAVAFAIMGVRFLIEEARCMPTTGFRNRPTWKRNLDLLIGFQDDLCRMCLVSFISSPSTKIVVTKIAFVSRDRLFRNS